ncbi:MAG: OmpA family protein [Gemmatimonadales bacterium]
MRYRRIVGAISTATMVPALAAAAQLSPRVPLVEGLTIVTAVSQPEGDYESIKRIVSGNAEAVTLEYSADVPAPASGGGLGSLFGGLAGEDAEGEPTGRDGVRQVRSRRTILREDLAASREYAQIFREDLPETLPGTTALGVSRTVLEDLRTKGSSPLTMRGAGPLGAVGAGVARLVTDMAGKMAGATRTSGLETMDQISGTVERLSGAAKPFPVLLNGKPASLPVVTARGTLGDQPVELTLLDDPDNPLALVWKVGDLGSLRVVRIDLADAQRTGEGIERQLGESGRAVVYGIYFDFASAVIKAESEPVLAEIANILRTHPDWKVAIEGHTDAVGDGRSNHALSEQRAAAVRTALVERYQVTRERLSPRGFGESRPKATNHTLEGRAENRRVELVRR